MAARPPRRDSDATPSPAAPSPAAPPAPAPSPAAPERRGSPERTRRTLNDAWVAAIARNHPPLPELQSVYLYILKACRRQRVLPIPVADLDSRELARCTNVGAHAHTCVHCNAGARLFAHNLHLVQYTHGYFLALWLSHEDIDVTIVAVQHVKKEGDGVLAQLGRALRQPDYVTQYILCATRSMAPCTRGFANAEYAAAAARVGTQDEPRVTLGNAMRAAFCVVHTLSEQLCGAMRAYVLDSLEKNHVGPLKLWRLLRGEIQLCASEDGAGDDGWAAAATGSWGASGDASPGASADAGPERAPHFDFGERGCALCWQRAPLLNGVHVVPYTRAHAVVEWLVCEEELGVAIEYVPLERGGDGASFDGDGVPRQPPVDADDAAAPDDAANAHRSAAINAAAAESHAESTYVLYVQVAQRRTPPR